VKVFVLPSAGIVLWWRTDVSLITFIKEWFGAPHPDPHEPLFDPDLTPEEAKSRANELMREVRVRLERLKVQTDTEGRR
jgi:hypothetical protein